VVGSDHVVEHAKPKSLARLIQPTKAAVSVPRKFLEKASLVATMGDVPDKARQEMTVGARHRFSALGRAFRYQKAVSKAYIKPI
jgi:hypothetical protein